MNRVTSKLLVAAVCAAMAFPTVSPAQDQGHGAHPPSHQQGSGQHYDHNNGGPGRHDGGHGNGGPYPHYDGHDQHRNYYGPYRYYNYGAYRPYYYGGPAYYYGGYQPYYYGHGAPYYYGHGHHDSNDDALWAIGGLVVGAIIGGAAEHANQHQPAAQSPRNCDHVAYDSAGNPYVERSCDK